MPAHSRSPVGWGVERQKKTEEGRGEMSASVTRRQVTAKTGGAAARQGSPHPLLNSDKAELSVKLS